MEFKAGDKVMRIGASWNDCEKGQIYIVVRSFDSGSLKIQCLDGWQLNSTYDSKNFILFVQWEEVV